MPERSDKYPWGAGREYDSHGLYYYRARYYDPTIGRFISQDPIEFLAGDFNFYRYVGNDPVNWVDPSGLYSWSEFGYDTTKNVAGVCNSLTFGFTGWVGKKINTHRYGEAIANQTDQAIENSIGQKATDVGMVATGVAGLAKGGAKLGTVAWKNRKLIAKEIKAVAKCESKATTKVGAKIEGKILKICENIDKLKKVKAVNTKKLRYSQTSVTQTKESLARLKDGVAKGKIPAGDVIKMPDGGMTSMDNRRLIQAQKLGKALKMRIRKFEDALSWCSRYRLRMKKGSTWGDAAKKRIKNQTGKQKKVM